MNKYYSQYGGNPDWYSNFESNLRGIYNNVKESTGNLTLTGSGAIAIILKKLNMIDDLNNLAKPNDLDFIYVDKDIYHPNIENFTKSTDLLVKSITYTRNNNESYLIKSFDLIFLHSRNTICNINIDGIDVLHPKSLLSEYNGNEFDTTRNDNPKITVLNKILKFITKEDTYIEGFECKQFKLYNTKVHTDITNLPSRLFALDNESDDENIDEPSNKKKLPSSEFDSSEFDSNEFDSSEFPLPLKKKKKKVKMILQKNHLLKNLKLIYYHFLKIRMVVL